MILNPYLSGHALSRRAAEAAAVAAAEAAAITRAEGVALIAGGVRYVQLDNPGYGAHLGAHAGAEGGDLLTPDAEFAKLKLVADVARATTVAPLPGVVTLGM